MFTPKSKSKWLILISGVSVICLLWAVFIIGSPIKEEQEPVANVPENSTPASVAINTEEKQSNNIADIKDPQPESSTAPSPSSVIVPEIKDQPTVTDSPVLQPETKKEDVKVPIATPKEAPKPTEPPKPKPKTTTQDKSTPPVYDEKETQPAKKDSEPKSGDKNSKGQVWFPGFGWVDQEGPNQETAANDMYENGNKIGSMD